MIFQSPRISTLMCTCLCLFHMGYLSSDEHFSQRITSYPSKGKKPETYSEKTAQVDHLQRPNAPKETHRKVDWQVNQGAKKLQVALFGKQVLDSECTGSSPKLFSYNRLTDHPSPLEGLTPNVILEQAGYAFVICPRRNTKGRKDSFWKQKGMPLFLTTSKYHESGVLAQLELSGGWFLHMDLAFKLLEQQTLL